MGNLGYDGFPKDFQRERNLNLAKINRNLISKIADAPTGPTGSQAERIFDQIARTYLKGEALKDALGAMDPANYIPVESRSEVIASIQRVFPKAENFQVITFGQYKEACEFLASRVTAINEAFVTNFSAVDGKIDSETTTKTYKNINDEGEDWITAFLVGGSAYAGLWLAGQLNDLWGTIVPRATAPANEPKQWYVQGASVAVCLLIELGVTLAAVSLLYGKSDVAYPPEIQQAFQKYSSDPEGRKKVLEGAGYDYESLKSNKKFDDCKAIKDYCLKYISQQAENPRYDHWVAWLQVVEQQKNLQHSMAMAPSFSKKWNDFAKLGNKNETTVSEEIIENPSSQDKYEYQLEKAFNASVKNYFSSILTLSNTSYNKTFDSFSFNLDERQLCCIIYFLGPLDVGTLKAVVDFIRLTQINIDLNIFKFLISFFESMVNSVASMILNYVNQILSYFVIPFIEVLFVFPDNDLGVVLKYCITLDWLFAALDWCFKKLLEILDSLIASLQLHIQKITFNAVAGASIFVERRYLAAVAALLQAVYEKLDGLNDVCDFKEEDEDELIAQNDQAAEAVIDFVTKEMPELYPTLKMPEEDRRKYFSNVPGFTTDNFGVVVGPTDESGNIVNLEEIDDPVADCSRSNRAAKSILVGQKLAAAFRNRQ